MNVNDSPLEKLKDLLKTLFQFDAAELDFGIYRLMNYKRKELGDFIEKDLIQAVEKEFELYKAESGKELSEKIKETERKIKEDLGDDAIKNGQLIETYRETKIGKEYLELQNQLEGIKITESVQNEVFNNLYNFFSRYYEDGDFISKRRYSSKNEKYAIPYSGEEVKLYWANFDQYYIKTGEVFKNYEFNLKGWKVIFKTTFAEVEAGNNKGDRRYFVLGNDESVKVDKDQKTCLIQFKYRPLTDEDSQQYSVKTKAGEEKKTGIKQDEINAILKYRILEQIIEMELKAFLSEIEDERTILEKHLYKYTRKISSDFFIHKNLKGFLERELDYFIKTEVIDLNNLEQMHITRAKVVEGIGKRIIEFLAQIEEFQKMLWEKKKFVLKTDYVITIDKIPEEFHKEILENQAQIQEWKELGFGRISGKEDLAGKKLSVDTKHFDEGFKEKLLERLSEQGSLDDLIDGILIKSENWQALNLLLEKYREKVKCIHIDPPYNTQTSGFLYKNDYQHSSWLAMMENRIAATLSLLSSDGSYLCHIDENEYERLYLLFERFPIPNAGTVAWDKRNPMNAGRGVATQHEYIIWRSWHNTPLYLRNENIVSMLSTASEIVAKHGGVTEEAQKEYASWVDNNPNLTGGEKAYRYLDEQGRVYSSVSLRAPEPRMGPKFHIPLIHPVAKNPCPVPPNGFSRTPETLQAMIARGEIIFGKDETTQPRQKRVLKEGTRRQITSVIQDARKGKSDVDRLGLDFLYCHPVPLYEELIAVATEASDNIVLDFFAGSGTTAHAVINLNRQDSGRRKYILVEMGDWFETVLLPRIKKVIFCEKWKEGMPNGGEGTSHMVKYHYFEQYEDTLHNIEFPNEEKGQMILDLFGKSEKGNEYMMKYFLRYETEGSSSLLNLKQFENPFEYKLKIISGNKGEKIVNVDLIETFNYLIGLKVGKYKFLQENGRKYAIVLGERGNRKVAVVWRATNDIDLEKDKEIINKAIGDYNPDEVFINGDALYPRGYKVIETEFKALMGV